jgi:hypothetical protein
MSPRSSRSKNKPTTKPELCLVPVSRWFLACLMLLLWRWRRYVPPKCRLTFNGLHGVMFQKTELLRTTRGLISLWLYKEKTRYGIEKKCIYSTYSPQSSTHLLLRCSNFINPSKKNNFACAANHPSAANVASSILENFLPVMCFFIHSNWLFLCWLYIPRRTSVNILSLDYSGHRR